MQQGNVEMQSPGRSSFFLAPRRHQQRGQACAEYLVVTTALIAVLLLAAGETSAPLAALIAGLKSLFNAYSFTLSLP
jgi:Flp pilus assembly pilin Flp